MYGYGSKSWGGGGEVWFVVIVVSCLKMPSWREERCCLG